MQGGGVPLGSAPHLYLPARQDHRGIDSLCCARTQSHCPTCCPQRPLLAPVSIRDARTPALRSISEVTKQFKKITALSSPCPALKGAMKNLKLVSGLTIAGAIGCCGDGELPSWSQLALGMLAWSHGQSCSGLSWALQPGTHGQTSAHRHDHWCLSPCSIGDPYRQQEGSHSSQGNGKQTRRPHWRRPPSHTPAAQLHLLPSRLVFTACPLAAR